MTPKPDWLPAAPFAAPPGWHHKHSPHQAPRTQAPSAIVLHADVSAKVESTLRWLADPTSKVSYHIVVSRTGAVFQVVNPDAKAYHAGQSALDGKTYCNAFSVGVCLSNKNDGAEPYPPEQVAAAVDVCALLCRHYGIGVSRIVTHAAVATPTGRKTDPLGLDVAAFRAAVVAKVTGPR